MGSDLTALQIASRVNGVSSRLRIGVEQVLQALEFVADHQVVEAGGPASSLSDVEENVLREAGSLGQPMPELAQRASTRTAVRAAQLFDGALSVNDAAASLGVTPGRIRQRLSERTLLGIETGSGWRLPQAQFVNGLPIGGLDRVLPALPVDAHPIVVIDFLTAVNPDLIIGAEPVSPQEWLSTGGAVDPVVELAADVHTLP